MLEASDLLRELTGSELSKRTIGHLYRQCRLVGPSNCDDLISSVILECLEMQRLESPISDPDVFRAIDRVGHRLRRESCRRAVGLQTEHLESWAPARDDTVDLAVLREALASLSPLQLKIIEARFLKGEPLELAAARLGMSKRTLHRHIAELKALLRRMLSLQ